MTMTTLQARTVYEGADLARRLIREIKPVIDALNVDYDSAGGVKETLQEADLQADAALSGLTKTDLNDAMYAMTATLKTELDTAYAQLEKLASRAATNGVLNKF